MTSQIPRTAQRAERLVLRVLFVASRSDNASQDDEIRDAASAIRLAPEDHLMEIGVAANEARLLNEAARVAYWRRGSVQEALSLQTRAFGANPLDPEVVGNLAFLHLKQHPAQADAARQLALHALTIHDAKYPSGRIEDWTTLAIASALSGRDRDARNAWFVTLALAPNLDRQCRTAVDAYAMYGERLRSPVEAMLYRVHASGRPERSPFCEWPPHWAATRQMR
jgi:tetratricopeptide (TPR) repeat protein